VALLLVVKIRVGGFMKINTAFCCIGAHKCAFDIDIICDFAAFILLC